MRLDNTRRASVIGDMFWLGEVPVKIVKVAGIIVGIENKEYKTNIYVDDGSSVGTCELPHSKVSVKAEKHQSADSKGWLVDSKGERIKVSVPKMPVPTMGVPVTILGKVYAGKAGKFIKIDEITESSYMEEARHSDLVIDLHKTKYSQPFVLPKLSYIPYPATPKRTQHSCTAHDDDDDDDSTPRLMRPSEIPFTSPILSPTHGTPKRTLQLMKPCREEPFLSQVTITSSVSRSSVRVGQSTSSALRLSHPERLRSKELTRDLFRFYVLHFMQSVDKSAASPQDSTQLRHKGLGSSIYSSWREKPGFGLSYLRRVPELHRLAHRILAEERRQDRKRRRLQEKENETTRHTSAPKSEIKARNPRKEAKALFSDALRKLWMQGSIVQNDAKSRSWNEQEAGWVNELQIWGSKGAQSQARDTSSLHEDQSRVSAATTTVIDDEEMEISDVDENEECHIPVTDDLLSAPVLEAIKLALKPVRDANKRLSRKPQGVPMEDILQQLQMDDTWAKISDITKVLRYLEQQEVIWEHSEAVWAII
ncbi:hypothetical protein FS842_002203 [Serendipita sp. 407]|nr:hypothetical protein FS842_002203 [Serendipita sp. 407]